MTNVIQFRPPPDEPEQDEPPLDGKWRPLQGTYRPKPVNSRRIGKLIWNTLLVTVFLFIIWPVVYLTLVALAM